jgi:hypothetical protein
MSRDEIRNQIIEKLDEKQRVLVPPVPYYPLPGKTTYIPFFIAFQTVRKDDAHYQNIPHH